MKSVLHRIFFLGILAFLSLTPIFGQHTQLLQANYAGDSSYYDITEIAPGRFWMAGENGLLNEVDAKGNIHKVDFPDPRLNILRIQTHGENVYLGTDQGGLFKYHLGTGQWRQAIVPNNFYKRCFYDMLVLPEENKLMLSGGHQKIAKGQKTLPLGFIASIDLDFQEALKVRYKNSLGFVWAMEYSAGKVYAASFTGLNTKILTASVLDLSFKKQSSVPGVIHHLEASEGSIYYSGTASTKYAQHGITGKIGGAQKRLDGYGCIWSIKPVGEQWISLDYAGNILVMDDDLSVAKRIQISQHSLYELEIVSENRAIIVGHGSKVAMLDLEQEAGDISANK